MTSERKKGRPRKVQPTSETSGPKQRTLFDSFGSRAAAKITIAETAPVIADVNEQSLHPEGTATTRSEVVATPNKQSVEIHEISDSSPPTATTALVKDETSRARSPSVVIIDSSPEFVSGPLPALAVTASASRSVASTNASKSQSFPETEGRSKDAPIIIVSSPIRAAAPTARPDKPLHPFFATNRKNQVSSQSPSPRLTSPLIGKGTKKTTNASGNELPAYPDQFSQHVRGPQTSFSCKSFASPFQRIQTDLNPDNASEHSYDFLKRAYSSQLEAQSYHTVHLIPTTSAFTSTLHNSTFSSSLNDSTPTHIKSRHPAISHLASFRPEDAPNSRRPWCDKWRPSTAEEVLGNERSAVYLRDWLRALEVQWEVKEPQPSAPEVQSLPGSQRSGKGKGKSKEKEKVKGKESKSRGTKRPRIVRAVDKSRKKRSNMDWILESDEEEDEYGEPEWLNDGFDEFGGIAYVPGTEPPASSPASSNPGTVAEECDVPDWEERPPQLGQLHNTILLAGPSGSGKTACVYACAEELGWDVFEVYPGIGKRNGASIDNLVGEVGKNHLVLQNRAPASGAGDILQSYLKSKGQQKGDEGGSAEPESLAQFSPRKKSSVMQGDSVTLGDNDIGVPAVRQSLILLEEVDILFKEDTNFWSTVTKIIQECKRPIICTCNDVSLVPTYDLPLQSTLMFEPPPKEVASYYLQALCSAEGFVLDREQVEVLYSAPLAHDPRRPGFFFQELHVADIRRTINTLQFQSTCQPPAASSTSISSALHDAANSTLRTEVSLNLLQRAELLSFVDSDLVKDFSQTCFLADDLADWFPSNDDETGHSILHDHYTPKFVPFEVYDRHIDIVLAAIQIARGGSNDSDFSRDAAEIQLSEEDRRRIHQGQMIAMREYRREIMSGHGLDGSVSMEFGPYIRQMVEADDLEAEREKSRLLQMPGKRKTMNSNRPTRIFQVSEAARSGLCCGGLV
ncbi:hypothetical protein CPB83DRAFT_889319 [Crepidotus variabilis]|uniref:AAA+ ATPase domain-containing protein n=1 Tax=Crepidotus variabilis TaxID=179855 RepID=A0A9P6EQQ1_9AGAR|nr:hypothetical protein CPB83DRAFT_889319 [Crepidotus variabilis]